MIRHEAHMIGKTGGVSGLGASAFGRLVLEDAAEKIVAVLAVILCARKRAASQRCRVKSGRPCAPEAES